MNLREEFEKETGLTTGIVGFRHEYVLWLESKLQQGSTDIEIPESHSDQIIDIMNSEKSCANCDKLPTCRENERTEACNAWKPITHNHATK